MSNESQDYPPLSKEIMEIELESRKAIREGKAPEMSNDVAELGPPQADTDNDNDQDGSSPLQEPAYTGQSAQSSPNENYVLGSIGLEVEGNTEPRSHPNQDIVHQNVPADLTDEAILSMIRALLIDKLHQAHRFRGILDRFGSGGDAENISGYQSRLMRNLEWSEIPEPFDWSDNYIGGAWPKSRDVAGQRQYIIESDGVRTNVQAHLSSHSWPRFRYQDTPYYTIERIWLEWCFAAINKLQQRVPGTVESSYSDFRHRFKGKIVYCSLNKFKKGVQGFPISVLACALSFEEPFRLSRSEIYDLKFGKSTSFLSTEFRGRYSVESHHDLHNTIHWQIRYFSPLRHYRSVMIDCLCSKRQAVTLQHGPEETVLQEKRAVVSFRVLKKAPELFSILIVQDEQITDIKSPDQQFDVNMFWKGYMFPQPNEVNPLTYYLLEICRVFKMCMDAWGETLSTIDKLVHVKLEDLDELKNVEELMFDNSFKRSKDYFVALQTLRIIDEWLDEVQSTVEDMFKDPVLLQASMWEDKNRSDRSFEVAIRYVNELTNATKSRVQKKHEEINSLRDGLFNATSLRESTKAMALNQAIYVFTVVTVLFTPVSFLATFWALPFLNNPAAGSDMVPEPSAFRNSFIIMPLLTYALVIGVAWFVGQRNSARTLLELVKVHWGILWRLMTTAWNSLPRMPWR